MVEEIVKPKDSILKPIDYQLLYCPLAGSELITLVGTRNVVSCRK